ncbi:molybdate ABC transporter ATP-binding protein ModF [Klebsiella grimontii]|uniref:molybdate ABC transporter ATP-binding protein ModF n=1 Tax=Klebsiella grimontii TaxID=2058152 RepID=UPI0012B92BB4|nr:molybdate ABC transporter ATP-binding protein ModF [Klebsiella grimontii]QMR65417.1 molybdate ABC transporter ATP-binding protein ModF [Klebsiella grimontii]WDC44609.1 molybdate ABC transporter ATP-binding protein ModF [Klebsiella grimontii]
MSLLQISQGTFRLSDTKTLNIEHLSVRAGESWAFVGSNGSGKSALARALSGELTLLSGQRECTFSRITRLSFEQLQKLVSDEWQRNNTDLLSPGEEDTGRTTAEIIQDEFKDVTRCARLAEQFAISHLLERRFKYLSTGETRKTLLCQALMGDPDLLILDEPFDGLDVASRQQLAEMLARLNDEGIALVLVLNRFDEIPAFVQYAGVLADCVLSDTGEKQALLQQALIAQLAHSEKLDGMTLPEPDAPAARLALDSKAPLIVLNDGLVSYNDRPIINRLSWTVNPGEHWQIVGPNGAGKSTLLSLVTGDHPQGYSNDLTLFGRRRGSGETIWDIKKHIGHVSSSLHLEYRVSTNVRNVILSGYFDSIGIYQAVSDKQHKLVQNWLDILGIDQRTADAPFHSLSWGQQRLALIVRALVKHPTLLILDEPLQGLDPLNRQLVRRFVDVLISEGATQLLFVSHHAEDAPDCITHRLAFVRSGDGYTYQQGPLQN